MIDPKKKKEMLSLVQNMLTGILLFKVVPPGIRATVTECLKIIDQLLNDAAS